MTKPIAKSSTPARLPALGIAALVLLLVGGSAGAAELDLALAGGGMVFDEHLGDYGWRSHPGSYRGGELKALRGAWSGGLRLWRAGGRQSLWIDEHDLSPELSLTGVEFLLGRRLARAWGNELWLGGQLGRMRIAFDPERLSLAAFGLGDSDVVEFAPITEWCAGGSLGLRRPLWRDLALGFAADYLGFALDTQHRRGDEILRDSETFANWRLSMTLSWCFWRGTDPGRNATPVQGG